MKLFLGWMDEEPSIPEKIDSFVMGWMLALLLDLTLLLGWMFRKLEHPSQRSLTLSLNSTF